MGKKNFPSPPLTFLHATDYENIAKDNYYISKQIEYDKSSNIKRGKLYYLSKEWRYTEKWCFGPNLNRFYPAVGMMEKICPKHHKYGLIFCKV